jgi:hypothetical protein
VSLKEAILVPLYSLRCRDFSLSSTDTCLEMPIHGFLLPEFAHNALAARQTKYTISNTFKCFQANK